MLDSLPRIVSSFNFFKLLLLFGVITKSWSREIPSRSHHQSVIKEQPQWQPVSSMTSCCVGLAGLWWDINGFRKMFFTLRISKKLACSPEQKQYSCSNSQIGGKVVNVFGLEAFSLTAWHGFLGNVRSWSGESGVRKSMTMWGSCSQWDKQGFPLTRPNLDSSWSPDAEQMCIQNYKRRSYYVWQWASLHMRSQVCSGISHPACVFLRLAPLNFILLSRGGPHCFSEAPAWR